MEERGGTRVGTEKMLLNRRVEENLVGEKGFKINIGKMKNSGFDFGAEEDEDTG
ncbi:hypothetical protein LR48_Vigan10g254800 [Vigna angularis]|uniref:Uncharacterized protein n=1 Tax=Phaseolus angularis TaxID=3914 RepID=A0A0L9VNL2_PHAAN|nr:hypothetical protein LR48_Vigan10g254800 [Vigna angularis]